MNEVSCDRQNNMMQGCDGAIRTANHHTVVNPSILETKEAVIQGSLCLCFCDILGGGYNITLVVCVCSDSVCF
jgi:hypothetical protein